MRTDRFLISYEGPSMGIIFLSDVSVSDATCSITGTADAAMVESGDSTTGNYLEIRPGGRVMITASEELLKSIESGVLCFFMRMAPGKGIPPVVVYGLVDVTTVPLTKITTTQ